MHPNLVNYALSYSEHGFSVIPIGNNKRPLIKFADKPPLTNTEIRDLWKKYPTANIALKTDKFFVIDVDRHGGEVDGMESIKKLGHDEWFKDTLTERTAHNGFHFFFTKPAKVKIQQNIGFLPSVDLKAHENNYVGDHLHIRGEYQIEQILMLIHLGSPPHTWRILNRFLFSTISREDHLHIRGEYSQSTGMML